MKGYPVASILIITRNKPERLDITLYSLSKQVCKYPFEVIVVDDGSEIDLSDVISKYNNILNIVTSKIKASSLFNV